MKTCPYCRKKIDVQAIKCPHCASAFDGAQMEGGRREVSRQRWGTFWLVVLAFAAFIWWLTRDETINQFAEQAATEAVRDEMSKK